MPEVEPSFPRQHARTQRFTLGEPRNVAVSPDGQRVVFVRSRAGDDPVNELWVLDVASGEERLVADPRRLLAPDGDADDRPDEVLPPEERARRERAREGAGGITAYATDAAVTVAAFALDGRLFAAGLLSGRARPVGVAGPVFDPRPDPLARRVAYVSGPALRIGELDGSSRVLVGPGDGEGTVSWGSADFVAAEEMHRFRGYWWSPDGERLAVCRVDERAVGEWTIADPANPGEAARTVRYPAAGTANATVSLHVVDLDGTQRQVEWDADFFPYLAEVAWSDAGLILQVQARDQRGTMVLRADPDTGETVVLGHDYDDAWIELVPGTPRLTGDGALVTCADRDGVRRILVNGEPLSPTEVQVRSVVAADASTIVFLGNDPHDATELHVFELDRDGSLRRLTGEPGVHGVAVGGPTHVIRSATLDEPGVATLVHTQAPDGTRRTTTIRSSAQRPVIEPNIELFTTEHADPLTVAVLLPHDHDGRPLPVLLDPYGGPHALRVTKSHNAFLTSQWFADQGFAVIVADGRGTPGRGSAWERAVHHDLATAPLADQIAALRAAAERHPELDLERVAIRGWSFGGYLAALAVLRRPDVFHAAVAGAPVTDWRLYDTHYTERYLGDPAHHPDSYDRSSLFGERPATQRPLLLIHGLADDNVVAAHTLRLSSALLAAGHPHQVLPLVGVSHMTPQEVVAENLLLHQSAFLRDALGMGSNRADRAPTWEHS